MSEIKKHVVLIADDNPDNLRLLENIFVEQNFSVRAVTDGEAALSSAIKSLPDIILLDVHMPVLDGYQTCRELKHNQATHDIPIIFISALSESFNKVKAFEIGGDDYLTKPIYKEELLARVNLQLKLRSSRHELSNKIEEYRVLSESMFGREEMIVKLKREVNELRRRLNEPVIYTEVDD